MITAEASAPACLELLPHELLSQILIRLADDDYHMLTLPLTCAAFRSLCATGELGAARLVSRLRQVESAVVEGQLSVDGENEWALAHASAALDAADSFLCPDGIGTLNPARVRALCAAPGGAASLRALSKHCRAPAAAARDAPPAKNAEALFFETEARRLRQGGGRKGTGPTTLAHIHRETASDRAALDAAAAIGLTGEANRAGLRREIAAQAQRQVDATCRRNWKLLTPQQRGQWERWAVEVERHERQCRCVVEATALVAARLLTAIEAERDDPPPSPPDRRPGATGLSVSVRSCEFSE